MLRYVRHAADRMDVSRHYSFSTKVVAAVYSDERTMWDVTLDDGRVLTCRFLISASGPLSASRLPDFEGINDFEGQSFHSSDWPTVEPGQATGYDFTGKRVGVIGTRSEEHTSELQSLMRISYSVFCLK